VKANVRTDNGQRDAAKNYTPPLFVGEGLKISYTNLSFNPLSPLIKVTVLINDNSSQCKTPADKFLSVNYLTMRSPIKSLLVCRMISNYNFTCQ
jgi:hypothetical protein